MVFDFVDSILQAYTTSIYWNDRKDTIVTFEPWEGIITLLLVCTSQKEYFPFLERAVSAYIQYLEKCTDSTNNQQVSNKMKTASDTVIKFAICSGISVSPNLIRKISGKFIQSKWRTLTNKKGMSQESVEKNIQLQELDQLTFRELFMDLFPDSDFQKWVNEEIQRKQHRVDREIEINVKRQLVLTNEARKQRRKDDFFIGLFVVSFFSAVGILVIYSIINFIKSVF